MAGELSLGFSLNLSKSGAVLTRSYSASVDVQDRPVSANVSLVTLAGLELPLDQVATIGQVVVKHLSDSSTAAYVTVGASGGDHAFKLKPGEWVSGRWNLAAVHVLPDAGQAWVEWAIVSA
jgi:hypothetical protein